MNRIYFNFAFHSSVPVADSIGVTRVKLKLNHTSFRHVASFFKGGGGVRLIEIILTSKKKKKKEGTSQNHENPIFCLNFVIHFIFFKILLKKVGGGGQAPLPLPPDATSLVF